MMYQNLITIRNTHIRIPGLKKKYRFLHITDSHLLLYDKTETTVHANYALPRIQGFAKDGIPTQERFEALWQYIREHSDPSSPDALDGVLLTGDILDFPSQANMKYLDERLSELTIPYVYVLGNHDWAYLDDYHTPHAKMAYRPLFSKWSEGNHFVHKKTIGELTFVALDDTTDLYEDGIAETLSEMLKREEQVLIMQHIPFYVPSLHEDTVAYWKEDLNIGGEGFCKNDNWKEVASIILDEHSPVRALITGHLHFWHEDMLGDRIPQFVTATATEGNASLFIIEG